MMKLFSFWRVKTPLLLQLQLIECGSTSLGIILGYYGKFISQTELRYQCCVSRDGCSGLDITKAAAFYGMESAGYQMSMEELQEIKKPAILYWDYNHFVVLEGFSKSKVFVNDPAHGHIAISKEEFQLHYSGVALLFTPKPEFAKSSAPPSVWKRLKRLSLHHPESFVFIFFSGLFLTLPYLAIPLVLRLFIDFIYDSNDLSWQMSGLMILVFSLLFGLVFTAFHAFFVHTMSQKISLFASSKLLQKLLRLPLLFYQQKDPREIARRVQLASQMAKTVTVELIPAGIGVLFSFFYAIILFFYDPVIASITLAGALICLLAMKTIYKRGLSHQASFAKDEEASETCMQDELDAIVSIKSAASEPYFFRKWSALFARFLNREQQGKKKEILLGIFPVFTLAFTSALLMGTGSREVLAGKLTLGMLAAMQIYLLFFFTPFKKFINLLEKISRIKRNLGRLDDVAESSLDPFFIKKKEVSEEEGLKVEAVVFGYYPFSSPQFEDISFHIKPGSWLGVTGHVGAGKSTLGKLAAGLLHPWKGKISCAFQDIAWVSQESFLFAGSFRDNITLWDEKIPAEKVIESAKTVFLPIYEEDIQEGGKNLSFGERQQLELARALVHDPKLLIIDEGMNALELSLQKKILSNLRAKGISCLIISHAHEVLQECEEIVVLDKGKIRERGNDCALLQKRGLYYTLFGEKK